MLQTFRRVSDNSVIVSVRANVAAGLADARDGTVRHGLHPTATGVLVELESTAPAPHREDRPVTLECPSVLAADRTRLFDIRDGLYGVPVRWENSLQAATSVVVLSVVSKAWPGAGATLNANFRVTVLVQPVTGII
jgi:hypothetical protein